MAATEYPKRQKYFANKFVRKMTKVCLANEIGPEACWMLTIIAHTEDAKQYRGPVTYFNGQLFPLVGLHSVDSLDRARSKAIKAGWLQYIPGAKGKAGTYWVSVPKEFQDLDDLPTDESEDEFSGSDHQEYGRETRPQVRKEAGSIPEASRKKAEGKCGTFLPVPNPDPDPNSAKSISSTSQGDEKKPRKKKERPVFPRSLRDPLFDAIVEVTGAEPVMNGTQIGNIVSKLLMSDPPFTPDDVRALPKILKEEKATYSCTLGVVEHHMYKVRQRKVKGADDGQRLEAETQALIEEKRRREEQIERERLEDQLQFDGLTDEGIPDESF